MSKIDASYPGQRLSYDGALCTVRCALPDGSIPGTKGEWLGVEWDDPRRGKHDGTLNSRQYFKCRSSKKTAASFVRPARRSDPEQTVLEAIRGKYQTQRSANAETVVISGKVAQEIGFTKIAQEQSMLSNLRVVLVDQLCVSGIISKSAGLGDLAEAQIELVESCPNLRELDLSHNPLEGWSDIEDICKALPQLRLLRLNSIRFCSLASTYRECVFPNLGELHLNECLLKASEVLQILGPPKSSRLAAVHTLWLSQNELNTFDVSDRDPDQQYGNIQNLMLENNEFYSLDELTHVLAIFPNIKHISLQSNLIEAFGDKFLKSDEGTHIQYPAVESLNLAMNKIKSFDFIDKLPLVFPNLASLRISNNPIYDTTSSTTSSPNSIDTNFFLTLARVPNLKTLNYTAITARERDEGEIYYLSVTEKEIKSYMISADLTTDSNRATQLTTIMTNFPRYQPLCDKHGRDSILTQLTNPTTTTAQTFQPQSSHPPGSLASRLVNARIYLSNSTPTSSSSSSFTRPLPTTLTSSRLHSLVAHTLSLPPLQFTITYESPELDPVRDDLTTRSQIYQSSPSTSSTNARQKTAPEKWRDWGDWDVDHLVETPSSHDPSGRERGDDGVWNSEGHLVKDGRKWKRRETEIPFGMKTWGEYLDLDPDPDPGLGPGATGRKREVVVRVELKGGTEVRMGRDRLG